MKDPTVSGRYVSEKFVRYPERRLDLDRKASSLKKLQIPEQEAVLIVWKQLAKVAEVTSKPSKRRDICAMTRT